MRGLLCALLAGSLFLGGCAGGMNLPGASVSAASTQLDWPPKLGEPYPDLTLLDYQGNPVRLSSFKGKVLLIEPIGTNCPACNAFSGAAELGGFKGTQPQKGLPSIESIFPDYTNGVSLDDPGVVLVQVILYNHDMKAPSPEDLKGWAEHFGVAKKSNWYVVAGTPEMVGNASYNMIPGFQLIDRNFILRSDSTGHQPKDDLSNVLLPMVPTLIKEMSVAEAYQAIPHKQTTFDGDQAKMSGDEKLYLTKSFALVDNAVQARVTALNESQQELEDKDTRYNRIMTALNEMKVPARLQEYHQLIVEAITAQRDYLDDLSTGDRVDTSNSQVQDAHGKLTTAYSKLMGLYGGEGQHNKDAFFDHLCALDFI